MGRLVRFALIGLVNTIVDVGSFAFLMAFSPARGPVPYGLFQTCSFLLAAFTSYQLNRRWTWRDRIARPVPFMIVSLASAALSSATVVVFTAFIAPLAGKVVLGVAAAKLAAAGVSSACNFVGYHFWAFARPLGVECLPPRVADPCVSLVLPAYREARRLPATLSALDRWVDQQERPVEVWVADDGSDDSTSEIVREAQKSWEWLGLVRLERHMGKGGALREAYGMTRADRVVYTDADLSFSWSDVERVIAALGDADVVAAVRTRGSAASATRRVIHAGFQVLLSLLGLRAVHDPQCGLKGYRRDALRALLPLCRMNGFSFDVETLVAARALGLRVATVTIREWTDVPGSTVRAFRHGVDTVQALAVLMARKWTGAYGPDVSRALARMAAVGSACFMFTALAAIKLWQWHQWLIAAFDGGLYMQALWLTGHGHWNAYNFYSSQPNLADANQWLLVPLGYLARLGGPPAALAVQALAGALLSGAAFAYAQDRGWPTWPALAMGAVTFVHPTAFGTQMLDWHPDPLGVASLAWAIVFAGRGQPGRFLLCTLLALLTKNQAAVAVGATGASWLLASALLGRRRALPYALWSCALAFLFLVGNEWATRWLGGSNLNVAVDYRSLGGSIAAVALHVVTHPGVVIERVIDHSRYWWTMLAPLGGLPLLAPVVALPGLGVMALNSLADHPALTVAYDQYALWALPSLVFATVDAIAGTQALAARVRRGRRDNATPSNRLRLLQKIAVSAVCVVSLWWFLRETLPNELWRLNPVPVRADLVAAAQRIPKEAAVIGEPGTATAVAWRRYSGAWPFTDFRLFVDAVPRRVPVYVFVAPGRAFGGIAVARELAWIDGLRRRGAVTVFERNGVLLLRVR
ncbi:MAG: DUF2079 domain-containing protein [Clostridia bacterium]|nr:DUF2079 domain-containing protein [Clostridia bacterium]